MQLAERQSAGEVTLIDMNRNPYADAAITNKSLAVVLQSLLLYELTDKWSAGVGAGVKYEYLAKSTIEAALTYHPNNPNYYEEIKETKNTLYRRDVTLHLPVEVQYTLSDKLAAVTQLQFQVSNRTTQSSYKEHDVYLTVGINYSL